MQGEIVRYVSDKVQDVLRWNRSRCQQWHVTIYVTSGNHKAGETVIPSSVPPSSSNLSSCIRYKVTTHHNRRQIAPELECYAPLEPSVEWLCAELLLINCKIIYVAPSPTLANNGCPEFSPLTTLRLGLNLLAAAKPSCCGWPWGLDYCQERWTLCTRKELRVDVVRSRIERIQKGARARVFIIILVKVYPEGCNYLLFYVKVSILENLHELRNFVIRVHTLLWMKFSWQGGHVCSCCQKK